MDISINLLVGSTNPFLECRPTAKLGISVYSCPKLILIKAIQGVKLLQTLSKLKWLTIEVPFDPTLTGFAKHNNVSNRAYVFTPLKERLYLVKLIKSVVSYRVCS